MAGSPMMSGTQSPTSEMTVSSSEMSGEETSSSAAGNTDNQEDKLTSQLAFMSLNQNYIQQQQQYQQAGCTVHNQPIRMGVNCHQMNNGPSMQMTNGHHMQMNQSPPLHMTNGQQQMAPVLAPMQQMHMDGASSPPTVYLQANHAGQPVQAAPHLSPNPPFDSNHKLSLSNGSAHFNGQPEGQQQMYRPPAANNGLHHNNSERSTDLKMAVQQQQQHPGGKLSSPPECYQPAPYAGQQPNNVQVGTFIQISIVELLRVPVGVSYSKYAATRFSRYNLYIWHIGQENLFVA
jgi:hypothetical protein